MLAANILISIALVFIALSLACAITLGRRLRHPPARPGFGYTRDEVVALTARARARAEADPLGLRRPLFFRSVRSPSAGVADGGDLVQPGLPAVCYFRLIRGGRDV